MSCQSLAPARAFPAPSPAPSADEKDPMAACGAFHRSVRFSSESQSSYRGSTDAECRRDTPGSISLTALTVTSVSSNTQASYSSMSQSAPTASVTFGDLNDLVAPSLPNSGCRFPKLEECAHFHYERVSLGGLRVELVKGQECEASTTHCSDDSTADSEVAEGWVCLRVQSHVNESSSAAPEPTGCAQLNSSFPPSAAEWNLTRNADNFRMLDNMLHRCIYDRKVSGLSDLSVELTMQVAEDRAAYESLVSDYLHHFSIIADDTINCGSVLNWLQMDNRGHRLLVANEDSSSINTPAVAAAYSVRKYVSQARDEISFEVGDMISIIDMPGPQESLWWRGKRGFRVGFFPHHCVAVIGDKVPRHMTQPPPIVGSVAVAPIKPVLRKHGKLISLFRSFILSRPSRRSLKQQGILRERVFGCDLGEHLLNSAHDVPLVLVESASVIEAHGIVDGIYRLSGGSGLTQRLRAAFDEGRAPPDLSAPPVLQDIHAVASLLKMYFRELPNPLCTYQLYEGFVGAVQPAPDEQTRLRRMRETVVKLPPPHYRTLSYLMRHLRRVSLLGAATGMTARNMAIVWAPNLLRSPRSQHALQGVAVQAVVTEFLICYAEELFAEDQGEESAPSSLEHVELRHGSENTRRPKSLPLNTPTKLLSLEEARQRGGHTSMAPGTMALPPPSGAIAAAANTQLRPASHKEPKYIEVGSGPNNLPQYHTVIERPAQGGPKRGLKRSPSGWRGLFFRSKQQRPPGGISALSIEHPVVTTDTQTQSCSQLGRLPAEIKDVTMSGSPLRPVKSCESLQSETDLVGPLSAVGSQSLANSKQHTRSASCDSYFEPWQAELADMRLRLSPQERDGNIFSEEDDTTLNIANNFQSICSTPLVSGGCSVEPSPRRGPVEEVVDRKRSKLEEQLNSISYIDGTDSPVRHKPSPEKRHSDEWLAHSVHNDDSKRLCKDRDSPQESLADGFQSSIAGVKLRERNSPRKSKGASRYSGLHQPLTNLPNDVPTDTKIITIVNQIGPNNRVTWHGAKDNHSTLIKIDWPVENLSVNSLTASTLLSSPLTPVTPVYDPLESDSDRSENRQMIKIEECVNCGQTKCLKCELMDAKTRSSEMNETLIQNENLTEIESKVGKDYENVRKADFKVGKSVSEFEMTLTADEKIEHDSLESTPVHSTNISYQNLNRLSNISTNSSNSEPKDNAYENVTVERSVEKKTVLESQKSVMSSSHESSSSYSNISPVRLADELYECFSFNRPNYINLQSSGSSKSSMSPLKSPLKSTISITFKSPTKVSNEYESVETPTNTFETHMNNETPKSFESPPNGFHYENFKNEAVTPVNIVESPKNCYENTKSNFEITKFQNERDSVYEDIDLDKNLSIVEEASVPDVDASLPTDQACQPDSFNEDLIILESPIEQPINDEQDRIVDIYSQVKFFRKSIEEVNAMILESPEDKHEKGTVREVEECPKNSHESPKNSASETLSVHYENIDFPKKSDQPCVDSTKNDMTLEISEQALCLDRRVLEDKIDITKIDLKANEVIKMRVDESATQPKLSLAMPLTTIEHENGNQVLKKPQAKNLNVRQLANRFESPTEQKGPFNFKTEVKYPTLERKKEPVSSIDRAKSLCEARPKKELSLKLPPPVSPKTFQLSKNSVNARSLDENAFAIEFGCDKRYSERRKSLEVRESKKNTKYLPDLNLNTEEVENESQENISITPTTENKISLIQRFSTKDCKTSPEGSKSLLNFEVSKKLSRERIEKYKEERRNFLREKYSSQSFRSASPAEHLTRLKMKKQDENEKPSDLEKLDTVELRHPEKYERLFEKESDTLPKFERRNTVDLGQRMRFSLNRSANNLDNLMMASRSKDHEVPGKMGKKERDAGLFVREREGAARSSAPTGHPERKDKMSPSYNIKDMAAMFEQKSQHNAG